MTRFSATTLDLSRLPAAEAIKNIDFEEILSQRLEILKARLLAAGIDYDVISLETDPLVILEQVDALREVFDLGSINDAVKSVFLSHSWGTNLDHIGAVFGVARLEGEDDNRYRMRIQLAPEAYSTAGTAGGYLYHAHSVSPDVKNIGLEVPTPGRVEVSVLSRENADGTASDALVGAVRAKLLDDAIRPLTDDVLVKPARITPYSIAMVLHIPPGPDPTVIRAMALSAVQAVAEEHHKVGRSIFASALVGAGHVPNVRRVELLTPSADLIAASDEAFFAQSIDIQVTVGDD